MPADKKPEGHKSLGGLTLPEDAHKIMRTFGVINDINFGEVLAIALRELERQHGGNYDLGNLLPRAVTPPAMRGRRKAEAAE